MLIIIAALLILSGLVISTELDRKKQAQHRAQTWSLLTYIGTLGGPNFKANEAAKWQG